MTPLRLSLSILSVVLLTGSRFTAGIPLGAQNTNATMANGSDTTNTDANIGNGEDDDGGVVLFQQKTRTGLLSDFIIDQMVDQCDGDIGPAVSFYGCIENTTQLPAVWAAMGLNATYMRLRTIDIFRMVQSNLTEDKSTSVSLLTPEDSNSTAQQSNSTLTDLLNTISIQSDGLCRNVDGLLACLNPYLSSCFQDPDSSNDLSLNNQQPTQAVLADSQLSDQNQSNSSTLPSVNSSNVSSSDGSDATADDRSDDQDDSSSSSSSSSDDADSSSQTFFMVPFLTTQSQIFPLLQQSFMTLCDSQALPLKNLIVTLPCLLQSVDQATVPCSNACQNVGATINGDNGQNANSTTPLTLAAGPVEPAVCGSLRDCVECQLDMASQTCGQDVALLLQQMIQIYFNSLQCVPGGGNDNSIRQPFNVAIL